MSGRVVYLVLDVGYDNEIDHDDDCYRLRRWDNRGFLDGEQGLVNYVHIGLGRGARQLREGRRAVRIY